MFENVRNLILHFHIAGSVGVESIIQKLSDLETNLGALAMTTKDDVLQTVAAEKAEVDAKLGELNARIDALIAAGEGASSAVLEEINAAIRLIYTPAPVVVDPVDPVDPPVDPLA